MKRRHLLLGSAAAPWASRVQTAPADTRPQVDWPAIQLLDGGPLAPGDWQGVAAVVVFWATYCPYCQRHNVHVDALHRAVRGQPLRVLGVALDTDPEAVRRYMARHRFGFPVALDNGTLRRRLTTRRVIPMTCTVDRQGRLVQAIPGEMAADDVQGLARALLRPAA